MSQFQPKNAVRIGAVLKNSLAPAEPGIQFKYRSSQPARLPFCLEAKREHSRFLPAAGSRSHKVADKKCLGAASTLLTSLRRVLYLSGTVVYARTTKVSVARFRQER